MSDDDTDNCGWPTNDGDACLNPAGEDGRCWIPTHGDPNAENPAGRPKALTDDKKEVLFNAVRLGLHVRHQAAVAGVHPDTLRRAACCLETLRDPRITAEEPCEFCERYAQAHGEGAMNVLEDTKPEFRASASFGYTKTEAREVSGPDGGPIQTEEVSDEELAMLEAAFDDEPET